MYIFYTLIDYIYIQLHYIELPQAVALYAAQSHWWIYIYIYIAEI